MPYVKQPEIKDGNILKAEYLHKIEDGIIEAQQNSGIARVKDGLTVAIIGDSISTHPDWNVCEIVVQSEDVGRSLSSYITYYDIGKTISLDGKTSNYTIQSSDVSTELHFIPCQADVGKKFGEPLNYNRADTKVWWLYAAEQLGFTPIAATWSGSSITSHTHTAQGSKAINYAWHDATIRKLGKRVPGTMERVAPDVVLVYRGTNDQSHSKSVRLTPGYFDPIDWTYPSSDSLSGGTYGYKEGLSILIKKIRTTYPKAKIMLCTCNVFKRDNYGTFPVDNGIFSTPQMNAAIRETADFFGCHTIDLDKCGITFENCYESGYITDSATTPTHPNSSGHQLMGQQAVCDLLNKLHILDIEPISNGELKPSNPYLSTNTAIAADGNQYLDTGHFSYIGYPLESETEYIIPFGENYCIYDINDTKLVSGSGSGQEDFSLTTPQNTSYINVCFKYSNLSTDQVVIRKANLYGGGQLMNGKMVNSSGEINSNSSTFVIDMIPVEANTTYHIPFGRNSAALNAQGEIIATWSGNTVEGNGYKITTPDNTTHLRTCVYYTAIPNPDDFTITKQ